MLGANMGELHLDISLNGFLIQDIIPAIIGNQGSAWMERTVDLTPYKGDVRIIFRAIRGTGFTSDIAVDQITLRDALPVGVSKNELVDGEFSFYPNPVNEVLTIRSSESSNIQIVSMLGSVVEEATIVKGLNQLDATSWTPGVYFIRMLSGEESKVQKFIKQ
jgi:hypothetical protein